MLPDVRTSLQAAFTPKSVAVIGASANPAKYGYQIIANLLNGGFSGPIYPVNPKGETICGLAAFPSLARVPGPVDLAVIVLPSSQTVAAVRSCAAAGVKVAVVIAAGFAEVSEAGARNQEEMVAVARGAGLRLVGPNCQGLVNFHANLVLSFSFMYAGQIPGPVSIISQSGSYCGIVSSRLGRAGVGTAKVVSSGNEADLGGVDYLAYLADDPDTRVVLAHLEGISDPRRFAQVIGAVAARKPLVINKTGRTEAGSRQAQSHSGALASNDRVLSALFRQRGVVRAHNMEELVNAGLALAGAPPLTGTRLAVVSSAGGLAVEMADLVGEAGFQIPPFAPATQAVLRRHVFWSGTITNPLDFVTPVPAVVGTCLEAVLADPQIDGVAFVLSAVRDPEFAREVYARMQASAKPVLICWTAGRDRAGEALEYFTARGVPVFESTPALVQGLAALRDYWQFRRGAQDRDEGAGV